MSAIRELHDIGKARSRLIGYLSAAIAVAIWAAWISWSRATLVADAATPLTPVEIGLLRFSAPAILLAPFWLRRSLASSFKPPDVSWPALIAMLCWGAPFILFAGYGLKASSVAAMSALTPSAMPLFAAVFACLLFGEGVNRLQLVGMAFIAIAGAATAPGLAERGEEGLLGGALLLGAAASWAIYTIGFRASGLAAVRAAGLVGVWTTILLLGVAALQGGAFAHLTAAEFVWQFLLQGVLTGVVSLVCFGVAIRRLGVAGAAPLTACVPPLGAIIGWLHLGERLDAWTVAAVVCGGLGVALATYGGVRASRLQAG